MSAMSERFFTAQDGKPATPQQKYCVRRIQEAVVELAETIDALVPAGRNKSLALTALEDVIMRSNRGIFAPEEPSPNHWRNPALVSNLDGYAGTRVAVSGQVAA